MPPDAGCWDGAGEGEAWVEGLVLGLAADALTPAVPPAATDAEVRLITEPELPLLLLMLPFEAAAALLDLLLTLPLLLGAAAGCGVDPLEAAAGVAAAADCAASPPGLPVNAPCRPGDTAGAAEDVAAAGAAAAADADTPAGDRTVAVTSTGGPPGAPLTPDTPPIADPTLTPCCVGIPAKAAAPDCGAYVCGPGEVAAALGNKPAGAVTIIATPEDDEGMTPPPTPLPTPMLLPSMDERCGGGIIPAASGWGGPAVGAGCGDMTLPAVAPTYPLSPPCIVGARLDNRSATSGSMSIYSNNKVHGQGFLERQHETERNQPGKRASVEHALACAGTSFGCSGNIISQLHAA